jgi:hypothetical protein
LLILIVGFMVNTIFYVIRVKVEKKLDLHSHSHSHSTAEVALPVLGQTEYQLASGLLGAFLSLARSIGAQLSSSGC